MECYNGKEVLFLVILNLILQISSSTPVSDGNSTDPSDLNGKKLMEIGKKLNLPKLQMIGRTIENAENEIGAKIEQNLEAKIEEKLKAKICDLHPCSDWSEWSGCTARAGQFGSKSRTRRCSINTTTCEIDSNSKIEKEFGICIKYCPEGYNLTKNDFCLKFVADKQMSKDEAEKECQKDGGHLVNIDSEVKYEDVTSIVTGFSINVGIWVDGRRKDVSSPWKYTYGSLKGFFKWFPGYPQNNSNYICLAVVWYENGVKFFDTECTNTYYHICEIVKTM